MLTRRGVGRARNGEPMGGPRPVVEDAEVRAASMAPSRSIHQLQAYLTARTDCLRERTRTSCGSRPRPRSPAVRDQRLAGRTQLHGVTNLSAAERISLPVLSFATKRMSPACGFAIVSVTRSDSEPSAGTVTGLPASLPMTAIAASMPSTSSVNSCGTAALLRCRRWQARRFSGGPA